jgi:hypothetical protein
LRRGIRKVDVHPAPRMRISTSPGPVPANFACENQYTFPVKWTEVVPFRHHPLSLEIYRLMCDKVGRRRYRG